MAGNLVGLGAVFVTVEDFDRDLVFAEIQVSVGPIEKFAEQDIAVVVVVVVYSERPENYLVIFESKMGDPLNQFTW